MIKITSRKTLMRTRTRKKGTRESRQVLQAALQKMHVYHRRVQGRTLAGLYAVITAESAPQGEFGWNHGLFTAHPVHVYGMSFFIFIFRRITK